MNLYKSAALALDHLEKYKGSVKGSLSAAGVSTSSASESKRILALTIETLKYKDALEEILKVVPLLQLEKITFPKKTPPRQPSSRSLIFVLLHDLLFSARTRIEASDKWPPKEAILRHQTRLRAELVKLQIRRGKQTKQGLARASQVTVTARYLRWNPNIDLHRQGDWSFGALLAYLQSPPLAFKKLDEPVYPVPDKSFFLDPHLPECLLVFPPNTNWWHGDKWFEAGAVVVQDKSSCFPAKVMMEGWTESEGDCIDATAAPGNKTSHISAQMGGKRRIFAFEKSAQRYKTLEKMLERAGCSNVVSQHADFLQSDPKSSKFKHVSRILLDPSCSGSGIVNRLDYLVDSSGENEDETQNDRLEKLASFQLQMILHAFKFPTARRIVYSTCSIHPEEDEQVVQKALSSAAAKASSWTLALKHEVLPLWDRRGRSEHFNDDSELAEGVVRCIPEEDHTNGFFVACFVRREESDGSISKEGTGQKRQREDETVDVVEDGDVQPAENGTSGPEHDAREQAEDDDTGVVRTKTESQVDRRRRKRQKQKAKARKKERA